MVRDNSSATKQGEGEGDNIATAITVTMGVADAISADAAGSVAVAGAEADSSKVLRAGNRHSAHHSRQSFPMVRQRVGSIRSAKAASFANQ